ncbi:hypothetical protein U0035_11575 [Niabella yanshanensis]|uniref:RiboL-PSP-HEPN domain-containing protein n=1 Tax=Niabella yanshanensis TaxID=577386 RepID=A0ABZ0VZ54_9BACT|nr:hypothetical protein [Niabella yanshanensis]WQD36303.1 hypothetical protein U0035_11575 [Niabella yanshanensis]
METNDKFIPDEKEFWKLLPLLSKFPRLHNTIKKDFELLLKLTEESECNPENFAMLCRTSIRNLFSLIEADLYYYNLFDSYEGYDDGHKFFDKFKKTFKQICKTWNRQELQEKYFSSKLAELKELKYLRDKLTHPKEIEHIIAPTKDTFIKVKKVYNDYDVFISTIMGNFFISTTIPFR